MRCLFCMCPHMYHSVPQIHPPPFATLALVQNAGGGLYAGCDNFSHDYVLPSDKAWLHCYLSVGGGGRTWGGEMLPTLAVSWRASALRGEKAGCFHEVAGVSIVDTGCLHLRLDTLTVDRVALIKIPLAGLCAKNAGGLMCGGGGGIFAGHYGIIAFFIS